jgi:hypothetical protein
MDDNVIIEETQKKLREAHFFFRLLRQESQMDVRHDREAFEFYLNAFLSAARSVDNTLRFEEPDRYPEWFKRWFGNLSPDERDLSKLLTKQRNNSQKRGSAEVTVSSESVQITDLPTNRPNHPAYGSHLFGVLFGWEMFPATVELPVFLFQTNEGEQDVTSVCERYLSLLGKLVVDFLSEMPK